MMPVLVDHVSHRYGTGTAALHDVAFALPAGAILGLVGANGAGKSTLLQCCAGLRTPTRGAVRIGGHDARDRRALVGGTVTWVAADPPLPAHETVAALLRWVAPLHARWDTSFAAMLVDRLALPTAQRVDRLSRGGRMKLALVLALAPRPAVLILDEPLAGLDVPARDDVLRAVLGTVADEGTTVLLASHEWGEIETVLDHLAVLRDGRLVVCDRIETLQARFRRVTLTGTDDALDAIARGDRWLGTQRAGRLLTLLVDTDATPLPVDEFASLSDVTQCDVDDVPTRELVRRLTYGTPSTRVAEVVA